MDAVSLTALLMQSSKLLQNNVTIIMLICFTGTCICLPSDEIATVNDCITLVVLGIFCIVVVGAIIQTQLMPAVVLGFYLHGSSNMW